MPYWKCSKCHHEWESGKNRKCDWCGAEGIKLEEQTPLERMMFKTDYLLARLEAIKKCGK